MAAMSCSRFALVLLVATFGCGNEPPPEAERSRRAPASMSIHFSGLEYTSEAESSEFSLESDELVWQKRRFGAFSIAPFKEVVMKDTRVRLEFATPEEEITSPQAAEPCNVPERLIELASIRTPGVITRVIAAPFETEIVDGRGVRFRIAAERAKVTSKRGDLDLSRVTVSTRAGQHLQAAAARWRRDGEHLEIRGSYELVSASGRERGSGGGFLLDPSGELRPAPAPPMEQR
jgi:hypothetical protein